jgi:hypothetical protein
MNAAPHESRSKFSPIAVPLAESKPECPHRPGQIGACVSVPREKWLTVVLAQHPAGLLSPIGRRGRREAGSRHRHGPMFGTTVADQARFQPTHCQRVHPSGNMPIADRPRHLWLFLSPIAASGGALSGLPPGARFRVMGLSAHKKRLPDVHAAKTRGAPDFHR